MVGERAIAVGVDVLLKVVVLLLKASSDVGLPAAVAKTSVSQYVVF